MKKRRWLCGGWLVLHQHELLMRNHERKAHDLFQALFLPTRETIWDGTVGKRLASKVSSVVSHHQRKVKVRVGIATAFVSQWEHLEES